MRHLSVRTQLIALAAACLTLVAALSVLVLSGADELSASWRQAIATGALLAALVLAGFLVRLGQRLRDAFASMATALQRLSRGDLAARLELGACAETVPIGEEFKHALQQLHALIAQVLEVAQQMQRASLDIAQGHADLSKRTERQAASLEETASAMAQVSATVAQNAENAQRASHHASAASDVASRGGQAVALVVGTMEGISDSSRRISDIIGVIDGIAFQTNILALNAAVEAARAGEQGRGFAVVASEVRGLAHRSAEAAKEIRQLILNSVGRIDEGSSQVEQAGETMADIVDAVKRVNELIVVISAASREQARSLHQVSDTVQQLEKVTQQNATLVEHARTASDSIEGQAAALAQAVARFRPRDERPTAGRIAAGAEVDYAVVPHRHGVST